MGKESKKELVELIRKPDDEGTIELGYTKPPEKVAPPTKNPPPAPPPKPTEPEKKEK